MRRGTPADADIAAEVYLRARHRAIPEIPAAGAYEIPLRDEIELEKQP